MAADQLQRFLLSSFDYYAGRTTERFQGLTDDEYFWEPVKGCWSLRETQAGWHADWQHPAPEPTPVTTIAWRLMHVAYCLQEHPLRAVAFEGGAADWHQPTVLPRSASEGLGVLTGAIETWKRDLATVSDTRLWELLGSEAGPYAKDPVLAFVEHIHDEFIHHCAEIALLRDLYAHR